MNISAKGPVTISTSPSQVFSRDVLENLGVRALLSAGIGDHDYIDRIFSARITLPRVKQNLYEALIFNFVTIEDSERITLKMNSKALTLLILIYPKKFRKYINRFEEDFELLLSKSDILPKTTSELLNEESLNSFLNILRKTIITFENESLLNYEEFEMIEMFDEDKMKIVHTNYLEDLI